MRVRALACVCGYISAGEGGHVFSRPLRSLSDLCLSRGGRAFLGSDSALSLCRAVLLLLDSPHSHTWLPSRICMYKVEVYIYIYTIYPFAPYCRYTIRRRARRRYSEEALLLLLLRIGVQQVLARTKGPYLGERELYIFYTHDCCTVIMVYTFARGCCIRIQRAREAKNYTYKRRGTRYIYIYICIRGAPRLQSHTHTTRALAQRRRGALARGDASELPPPRRAQQQQHGAHTSTAATRA